MSSFFKPLNWGKPTETGDEKKRERIGRRDSRIRDDSDSATGSNNPGAQRAVDPQDLAVFPTEIFNVGDLKLTYAKLVEKYDPSTLKVLIVAPTASVEVHNFDADGRDLGRTSASEEKAHLARMHARRTEEAARTGGYAIPEVKVAPRDDRGVQLGDVSTEALADELRARGGTVTIAGQQNQQPPVDPAIQQLADTLQVGIETAQQIHAIMQQSQPAPQPQQPGSNSNPNPNSGRGGGVGGGR